MAVVGANGAGKSTLLLHLNGYYLAAKGMVNIGGYPVTRETVPTVRRAVGMTFQNADDQLFMPTVFEDVAFGPINLGLPKDEVERRVQSALDIVGASCLRDRPPYRLSGGEKRTVAIATVLSMSPDILVMDEPTSELDPRARRRLIMLLKSFTHTKIIATHDLDMALDVCERTLVLQHGRVIADGPTADLLLDAELMHNAGLEQPLRIQGCPVCSASQHQPVEEKPKEK